MSKDDPTRVITGTCRSSFMFVNKLEKDDYDTLKCRSQILIPKDDKKTINAIKDAIDAASQKKFGKDAKKNSSKFKYPLRDADQEIEDGDLEIDNPEDYEDHYFMNTTAYKIPQLVDADNERVEDFEEREEMCVSGNYFKFSITLKGFDNESKGVRCVLNNIMFIKEGERLDGGKNAEDDFEDCDKDNKRSRREKRRNR